MGRWAVIGVLAVLLLGLPAQPAAAQFTAGGVYGNAAPCLADAAQLAVTRSVDTIYAQQAATTGALYRLSVAGGATALAPVGARSGDFASRISAGSGVGSVYGLAYDDGARSGIERLFIAAYARRTASYGPLGPGGIYEYRFADASWRPSVTVPNAGLDRSSTTTSDDLSIVDNVGTTSLGDLEISPDGRQLFVMNLRQRRIERYDITVDPPLRLTPLTIPLSRVSSNTAVQAELLPFALEFHPVVPTDGGGARLFVGITDRALRSGSLPALTVLSVATESLAWQVELRQPLRDGTFATRLEVSNFQRQVDFVYPDAQLVGWYSWSTAREPLHHYSHQRVVFHPQPLLSDIEFVKGGNRMLLALRDRVSDTQMILVPPSPYVSSIGQGDLLGYRVTADGWALISSTTARLERAHPTGSQQWTAHRTDVFNDQVLNYSGNEPWYVENAQGALASYPTDGVNRRVAWTALLGNSAIGVNLALDDEPAWLGRVTAFTTSSNAAPSGDLELLCQTALVGGRIWFDRDHDGWLDADEPRLAGVTVEAYLPGADQPAARSVTNDNGQYRFFTAANRPLRLRIAAADFAPGGRLAGLYFTRGFVAEAGSLDSDVSEAYGWLEYADDGGWSGQATPTPLRDSQVLDGDFGLTDAAPTGSVGDLVWFDADRDGLQGAAEQGMAGLALQLVRQPTAAPGYRSVPLTQTSGLRGGYVFSAVEPGIYRLQASAPAGMAFTVSVPSAEQNSEIDRASGSSGDVVILTAQQDATRDVGLQVQQPDVRLAAASAAEVRLGTTLTVTLTVDAAGEVSAGEPLTLTLTVPAELTIGEQQPRAAQQAAGAVVWQLPLPAAGLSRTVTVLLQTPVQIGAALQTTMTLTAALSGTPAADDVANNAVALTVRLVRPELVLEKLAPADVGAGDALVYTLQLRNLGSAAATAIRLVDRLPDGLLAPQITAPPDMPCSWTPAARLLQCELVQLGRGQDIQLSYRAEVVLTAPAVLRNEAWIESGSVGDQPAGNTAQAVTQVVRPDLQLQLTPLPALLPAGTSVTLTLDLRNGGDGPAQGVALQLEPSAGLVLTAPAEGCTVESDGLICVTDELLPQAQQQLELALTTAVDGLPPQVTLTATVSSLNAEALDTRADNRVVTTAALQRPSVAIGLQAPSAIVGAGSVFPYEITLSNRYDAEPSLTLPAEAVLVTLTLPADVTFISAEPPPQQISATQLVWQIGTLQAQETRLLTVIAATSVRSGTGLTAVAELSTDTAGDDRQDNRAEQRLAVVAVPRGIGRVQPTLQPLVHSRHDPLTRDGDAANGVHRAGTARIVWPVGEVLDLGVMVGAVVWEDEPPWPYAYHLEPIAWSLAAVTVDGVRHDVRAADSRGLAGCRAGDRPQQSAELLRGCRYRTELHGSRGMSEAAMAGQAHLYWTFGRPGALRSDLFVYRIRRLQPVLVEIELEAALTIVNQAPGELAGLELPPLPLHDLPAAERRHFKLDLIVELVAPRRLSRGAAEPC